jgi:hypothetical protein
MTEKDWLRTASAEKMVDCLCSQFAAARTKPGRRKLRLLACACCRRIWDKLTEERDRQMVLVSEQFADGLVSTKDLEAAGRLYLVRTGPMLFHNSAAMSTAVVQPRMAVRWTRFYVCTTVTGYVDRRPTRWITEEAAHAAFVREVFGNPFQRPRIDKTWLRWNDSTVPKIAMGIYEERAFDRMPILADALLDAGCDNEEVLAHCRSDGPHVRGCWVIDLILGKG